MLELAAKPRTLLGKKAKHVRKAGNIPAILYGFKVIPQSIEVDARKFQKVWKETGETTLVSLDIEGTGKHQVLIHDVKIDALKDVPLHVDFYAVNLDRPIEAHIPLVFTGEAEAVKLSGGVFVRVTQELLVSALPKDLPHEITVDISSLRTFEDKLSVKDITLPRGVTVVVDADQVIALVERPRSEEEMAALESIGEVSLENIEIAGKKEKEEEVPEEEGGSEEQEAS